MCKYLGYEGYWSFRVSLAADRFEKTTAGGTENCDQFRFDSFGHSKGLVQILKKSGFDSYVVCRSTANVPLESEKFIWRGTDGSEILCHSGFNFYESQRDKADQKIKDYIAKFGFKNTGLVLWGVGNHGGGLSRVDMKRIGELMLETADEGLMLIKK
jgi:alpha-mannosidase